MKNVTNVTKKHIKRSLDPFKPLTAELVFLDPYTTNFIPCALSLDEMITRGYSIYDFDPPSSDLRTENYIEVLIDSKSLVSPEIIKSSVSSTIVQYFDENSQKIGGVVDINRLNSILLNIPGVARIRTIFKDSRSTGALNTRIIPGLQFAYWTPTIVLGKDLSSTGGSVKLEEFQFPSLFNTTTNPISNRIRVITPEIFSSMEAEY